MEMTKKIYLETLKSAVGRSILHYFKLTTTTVINHKFYLENAFQEILHRIENWTV